MLKNTLQVSLLALSIVFVGACAEPSEDDASESSASNLNEKAPGSAEHWQCDGRYLGGVVNVGVDLDRQTTMLSVNVAWADPSTGGKRGGEQRGHATVTWGTFFSDPVDGNRPNTSVTRYTIGATDLIVADSGAATLRLDSSSTAIDCKAR